ncbi:MAG: hypothetical protein JJU05_15915 [Verrucomicrobia bacterium]|nr:hypothetical protein [Verrucomicrobiota bacterium]MCH8528244.1 DUF6172 family protein [Kiritimatiellia bacterium]
MKKTFPLAPPGKHPDRHLEAVKHELRKYLRRENNRELPEGTDYWDFDCRFGPSSGEAAAVKPGEIIACVDKAAKETWPEMYVEILRRAVTRPVREKPSRPPSPASTTDSDHPKG